MQFDIRRFDIYRKVPKDLTQPTLTGACVSVCSILFIIFLMSTEFLSFLTTNVSNEIYVSAPDDVNEKIPVDLNVSYPRMQCDNIGLDIQDSMGRHEVGFKPNTNKVPINERKGCRFEASFLINRVPGNFHLSTHAARIQSGTILDMAHVINHVRFGEHMKDHKSHNPMASFNQTHAKAGYSHNYNLNLVATRYFRYNGSVQNSFQYSFAYKEFQQRSANGQVIGTAAIWFHYGLSPISIIYTENRKPFYHFITTFCAIIGGTFTVAGLIDSLLFTAHNIIKKAELGKLT